MERLDMDPFDTVYARMLFVSRRRTQVELAELLGLQQGTISEAKKRGWIPLAWCVRISDLFHVRMEWLRFGEPPVFVPEARVKEDGPLRAASGFWQPSQLSLEERHPGELPVHSTVRAQDGSFPVIGVQVFPLEFLRDGVEIFRVLEHGMAPVLNVGALVAVDVDCEIGNGDIVAVLSGNGLRFRRMFKGDNGRELRSERDAGPVMFIREEDWSDICYGKAIWAFQPL